MRKLPGTSSFSLLGPLSATHSVPGLGSRTCHVGVRRLSPSCCFGFGTSRRRSSKRAPHGAAESSAYCKGPGVARDNQLTNGRRCGDTLDCAGCYRLYCAADRCLDTACMSRRICPWMMEAAPNGYQPRFAGFAVQRRLSWQCGLG